MVSTILLSKSLSKKVIPLLCTVTEPNRALTLASPNIVWRSCLLQEKSLYMSKASNLLSLMVQIDVFATSNTLGSSNSGNNLTTGGIELIMPFHNLIMFGCWPTGTLFIGPSIEDSNNEYPAIVLYCKPSLYRSVRKLAQSTGVALEGSFCCLLHQLQNFLNFLT